MATGLFITSTIKESWQLFKKKWLTVYGLFLLIFVVPIIYMIVADRARGLFAVILFIAYNIGQLTVSMGVVKGMLALTRGQQVDVDLILSSFKDLGKYIVGTLMYAGLVLVGIILLVIPGIIWALKYMFVPFLIIDKGVNGKEAMKLSAAMTKGAMWDIIGFYSAMMTYMYLGVFALVIGLFVTLPVGMIAYMKLYNRLLLRVESAKTGEAVKVA